MGHEDFAFKSKNIQFAGDVRDYETLKKQWLADYVVHAAATKIANCRN